MRYCGEGLEAGGEELAGQRRASMAADLEQNVVQWSGKATSYSEWMRKSVYTQERCKILPL